MQTFEDTEGDQSPLCASQQGTNEPSRSSKADANPEDRPTSFPLSPQVQTPRCQPTSRSPHHLSARSTIPSPLRLCPPPFPLLVPNTVASTNHGASSAEPSPLLAVSRVHHFPTVKMQLPIGSLPQAPPSTSSTTTEASEQKGSSF